jgi:phospholipid/cholesterol/gamma-HCH transport system permease protein
MSDASRILPAVVPVRRGPLAWIGAGVLRFLTTVGEVAVLLRRAAGALVHDRQRWAVHREQWLRIGWESLPVVMLTGGFVGMVIAVQAFATLVRFNAEVMSGPMVNYAVIQQLSPTVTALIVTARVGSRLTAEIGTMKVSEQLDALRVLGTSPISYLVAPRVLACVLLLPVLTACSSLVGVACAALLLIGAWGVDGAAYWSQAAVFVSWWDVSVGCGKTAIFGAIIAVICCRQGLLTTGGASGVGVACTRAVVQASVSMFVANFLITLVTNRIYDDWLRP